MEDKCLESGHPLPTADIPFSPIAVISLRFETPDSPKSVITQLGHSARARY